MNEKPKYWFKRRRYGYGWIPVTPEGWVTLSVFLLFVLVVSAFLAPTKGEDPTSLRLVMWLLFLLSALFILIGICYAKGPVPRWRWGKKPDDNPDEDF